MAMSRSRPSWLTDAALRGSTQLGLFVILVLLWIIFSFASSGFLSKFNLNSLMRLVAVDVVVGFSQMVVLATGGMNLSVGAIGVCAIMFSGYLMQVLGWPTPLAIVGTLALGVALGSLNGLAIVLTRVNAFVVTLASASLFTGGMLILSKAVPLNQLPPDFGAFGRLMVGPVPALSLTALAIGVLLLVLFRYMTIGRQLLAVGANGRAARMSGVPVDRVTVYAHALSGALAAAAALLLTSRLGTAMPAGAGDDWLLPSFLAPVIGGTALAGGAVSVVGTILGALLVATIRSGLLVLQIGNFWLQLFLGAFLLAAILVERARAAISTREQIRRAA